MSFQLLKSEIVDVGLCQGCGLCAGSCKHLEMVDLKPSLIDYCIVEREGLACGKCYDNCPQAKQLRIDKTEPLQILALQSVDEEIRKRAASGGFVTTLNKYILENGVVNKLIEVKEMDEKPESTITSDPEEVLNYAGVSYGRSGVLKKLVEALRERDDELKLGVVGVPCEIRGAHYVEERVKKDFLKIGLFCNANMRTKETDQGIICSPCCNGCPAGVNAQGYINLIRNKKYQESVDLIREANPLPSICGRICTHECEYDCTLIGTNKPIAIRELKKFVTEWEMEHGTRADNKPSLDKKVAIVGAGPSGLTAGYYLANMGYKVTIFEKAEKAGGMLRFGVPKFRLPDEVLDYDIETVEKMGVEIKYNTPVGPDLTFEDLKKQGYEAIYLAIGQYKPRTLKLKGEDLPNVHTAIDFLVKRKYRYWENKDEFVGKTVGILGGGPVAVDVAQTALRLGAKKAYMVDIMDEETLKMVREEVPEKERELIEFIYDTATREFTVDNEGHLVMNCHKVEKKQGEDGRLIFEEAACTDFEINTDVIVIAVGQSVDYSLIDKAGGHEIKRERGKIVIDEVTFETNLPGVFAGGDIVTRGKNVAIAAIAHGKQAAISIDRYLNGKDLHEGRTKREQSFFSGPKSAPKDVSIKPEKQLSPEELYLNFNEISGKFDEEMALSEAQRCLSCNHFCEHCQDFAGVYADITAGEIGSDPSFTTVVVWTEKGKSIVEKLLEAGLVRQGEISRAEIDKAISLKRERPILEHPKSLRDQLYEAVINNGPQTIEKLAEEFKQPVKEVRYNLLRLVQDKKIGMKLDDGERTPIFVPEVEE